MENWGFNHWSRVDNKRQAKDITLTLPVLKKRTFSSSMVNRAQVGVGVSHKMSRPPGLLGLPIDGSFCHRIYCCHKKLPPFSSHQIQWLLELPLFLLLKNSVHFCLASITMVLKCLESSSYKEPSVFMKLSREIHFSVKSFGRLLVPSLSEKNTFTFASGSMSDAVALCGQHRVLPDLCRTERPILSYWELGLSENVGLIFPMK